MRHYVDLHIQKENEGIAQKALDLGFRTVGLVGSTENSNEVASRYNIVPRNLNELSSQLKKLRRRYVILSVYCKSVKVARQAAKDHRVDILRFPLDREARRKVWFDRHEATLASDSNAVYEISLSDILGKGSGYVSGVLGTWRRELENAFKYDVPVVISSGASSNYGLRGPKALASIMELVNVDEERALDMVSKTPHELVEKNRGKLDPSFIMPGVRIA